MHYPIVCYVQGQILKIEGALLLVPALTGLLYREPAAAAYLLIAVICEAIGLLLTLRRPKKLVLYAREGMVSVALAWIVLSLFGALPFVLCGDIPSFSNALFEIISGFTTTGASILEDVEVLSHASLIWRSFSHWVGGMGVIVFMLAIIPMASGYNMQLMKAESPGPSVGKLVPRVKESAKILYLIYVSLTGIQLVLLLLTGMKGFDAVCITFGTAGTGGFGIWNSSCGGYTTLQQGIITIFMLAFGVNFNAYYFLLGKDKKQAFRMEEVRGYFLIVAVSILLITINIRGLFHSLPESFHHAAFQVASIITTTGYSTENFDLWPMFSKMILILLMFCGACAGSTGGGIKVSRILILLKAVRTEIRHYMHPRAVTTMKMDGKAIDKSIFRGVLVYLAAYAFLFTASVLILSLDPTQSFATDFTAVAATFNNIGPGLEMVGPAANFNSLTLLSKYVLMFDMLAGRLELFPLLIFFLPSTWKKNA